MPKGLRVEDSEKTKMVSVRMTETEFARLKKEAEGRSTVSDLIRSRALGKGFSNSIRLKLVGELVTISTSLRRLAAEDQHVQGSLESTLNRLGEAIDEIAKRGKA